MSTRTQATNRQLVRDFPYALDFNGTTDFVDLGMADYNIGTDNWTMSAWVNPNDFALTTIIAKGSYGTNEIIVYFHSNNRIVIGNHNDFSSCSWTFIPADYLNKWIFVTVQRKGDDGLIFINGVEVKKQVNFFSGQSISSAYNWTIGARDDGVSAFMDGLIAGVRIYNRYLTETEIQNMYIKNIIPRDGLVAEYFKSDDDGSGDQLKDTSGNNNHGTITGADWTEDTPFKPRVAATNRMAVRNFPYALDFNGTTDFVDLGMADHNIGTDDFAISMWVKSKKDGETRGFFSKGYNSIGDILFCKTVSNTLYLIGNNYSINLNIESTAWDENKWMNLVVIRNGTTIKVYLNGEYKIQDTTAGADLTNPHKWIIGAREDGTHNRMDGLITDVRIYNRYLTETEIQNMYYKNIIPRDSLVAEYFKSDDDGSGDQLKDTSGNSNDGIITGAEWTEKTPFKSRVAV